MEWRGGGVVEWRGVVVEWRGGGGVLGGRYDSEKAACIEVHKNFKWTQEGPMGRRKERKI